MPFSGQPSRGCGLCRQRRVKCDLTRPGCVRCQKVNQECPGYRDLLEYRFRRETITTQAQKLSGRRTTPPHKHTDNNSADVQQDSHRVHVARDAHSKVPYANSARRRKPNPAATSQRLSDDSASSTTTLPGGVNSTARAFGRRQNTKTLTRTSLPDSITTFTTHISIQVPLSVPPRLSQDWTTYTIPLLLSHFASTSSPHRCEYVSCLPELITTASADSPLIATCNAVGAAYFFVRSGCPAEQAAELNRCYSIACKRVNEALQGGAWTGGAEAGFSVWLLSVYELILNNFITQSLSITKSSWELHIRGLAALLRSCDAESYRSERVRTLFWVAFVNIHVLCHATQTPPPPETKSWLSLIHPHTTASETSIYNICLYMQRSSTLKSRLQRLLTGPETLQTRTAVQHVLAEVARLEEETSYLVHGGGMGSGVPGAGGDDQEEVSIAETTVMNYYLGWRIAFHTRLLQMLHSEPASPSPAISPGTPSASTQPPSKRGLGRLPDYLDTHQLHQATARSSASIRSMSAQILSSLPWLLGPEIAPPPPSASSSPEEEELPSSVLNLSSAQNPTSATKESAESRYKTDRPRLWGDALRALWPIRMVAFAPGIESSMREGAIEVLGRIGGSCCIRQALWAR